METIFEQSTTEFFNKLTYDNNFAIELDFYRFVKFWMKLKTSSGDFNLGYKLERLTQESRNRENLNNVEIKN